MIALQALAAYAAKAYSPQLNVSITITNGADKQSFEVTGDNAMVLQSYQVALFYFLLSILCIEYSDSHGHWSYEMLKTLTMSH